MEEHGICGHSPTDEKERDLARRKIDKYDTYNSEPTNDT